jgi:hypothetical protein
MRHRIAAAAAVVACALPAAAQEQQATESARRAAVEIAVQEERAKVGVESRIVRGAPYSADAVTETVQVLADGNRIVRQSVTRVFRDSEGRTRRETVGTDGQVSTAVISDPVSESQWMLMPAQRVAHRNGVIIATPGGSYSFASVQPSGSGTVVATRTPDGAVRVQAKEAGTEEEIKQRQAVEVAAAAGSGSGSASASSSASGTVSSGAVAAGSRGSNVSTFTRVAPAEMGTMMRVPANATVNKEDLGQQVVEGVTARGTRTTTTIPAGGIGNVLPIEIVSEQWFSEDLKVLVMTRHADPRTGETVYKLTNVSLVEPARTMFEVPADYTIRDSVIRRKPELEK